MYNGYQERDAMNFTKKYRLTEVVYDMIHAYNESSVIREKVMQSPEPYRAMIYETEIIPREIVEALEGTDAYDRLVEELERQWG